MIFITFFRHLSIVQTISKLQKNASMEGSKATIPLADTRTVRNDAVIDDNYGILG